MSYRVIITRSAEKQMRSLTKSMRARMDKLIVGLEQNPRPPGVSRVVTTGSYRLRAGDYRIFFDLDDEHHLVTITGVRHRREAYR